MSDTGHKPGRSLERRLLAGALLGLVVYAAFALWADLGGVAHVVRDFPVGRVFEALGLASLGYLVRFIRWERYARLLGVRLKLVDSALVFLSGMALTVSPGKLGEALKSWLVRELNGTPVARTAPIVLAERLTDLLALLLLIGLAGLGAQPEYAALFWVSLIGTTLGVALLGHQRATDALLALVARLPGGERLAPKARDAFASARLLLTPLELVWAVGPAVLAWGLECVAAWRVVDAFAPGAFTLDQAAFAFALPLVAGAVAIFTPGGLGVTEGAMTALLRPRYVAAGLAAEAAQAAAVSATLIVRLCTLWYAMLVGVIALVCFRRRHRSVDGVQRLP